MSDFEAFFFIGKPVEFEHLCLVYPPTVSDVLNKEFGFYRRILTYSQEEIEDEYVKEKLDMSDMLTPLEFLLSNCFRNKEIEEMTRRAFYLFTREKVTFLYTKKEIVLGDIAQLSTVKDLRVLNETNFFDFQNLIRESMGEKPVDKPDPTMHPKIKAMKAKARYRDKIKAKKNGLNLKSILASICCMEMGLNPLNIGELSYAAIGPLMSMYQDKEKYDIDIRSLQAGAKKKDVQLKYWIRNLE